MSELILHHYDMSPYAEKIRLGFGLKELAWRSVQIPMVMPKPDLVALTGGYRRTPVLQSGADVYCDTKLIVRVLDGVKPSPPFYPAGSEATVHGLSRWAETTFMIAVTIFFGLDLFPEEFVEDRRGMVPPSVDLSKARMLVPSKVMQLRANVDRLDTQLRDGRDFLLGAAPCVADVSAYHPLMFLRMSPVTQAVLEPLPRVREWMGRVAAIGHGMREELDSKDAIAIARDAEPRAEADGALLPDGLKAGDPVVVLAEEYGTGIVTGELVASGVHEIAIRRRDERAGEVVVHFPREDFLVLPAG